MSKHCHCPCRWTWGRSAFDIGKPCPRCAARVREYRYVDPETDPCYCAETSSRNCPRHQNAHEEPKP